MEEIIYWMWLIDTKGIGAATSVRLYEKFGSAKAVYENKWVDKYLKVKGMTNEFANRLYAKKDLSKYEKLYEYMCKEEIKYITIEDASYPSLLKETVGYPPVLFYKGTNLLEKEKPMISIVGARYPTQYGMGVAREFGATLARNNIDVVSGMALGIDAAGHHGALDAGGQTIAVLGCGVDIIYPPSNKGLYKRIIAEGSMIISEYLPGTPGKACFFPARNRIISGLCYGSIIVEASFKSGSLITARYAGEQGREVYSVPGNINSKMSEGTNALIKDGARLVQSAEDVMSDLYYVLGNPTSFDVVRDVKKEMAKEITKEEKIEMILKNNDISRVEEDILKSALDGKNEIDYIMEKLEYEVNVINSSLTMLEIRGIVNIVGNKLEVL